MTFRALGIAALAAAAFALSGCGKQEEAPATKAVQGNILERSISDDMLPYDTVRSQPPLLAPQAADGAAPQSGGGPASASTQETPEPDVEAGAVESEGDASGGPGAATEEPTPAEE